MKLLALRLMGPMLAVACSLASAQAFAQAKPVSDSHPFHQCASCHSLDTSANAFGPTLIGVYGRPAGTVPRDAPQLRAAAERPPLTPALLRRG